MIAPMIGMMMSPTSEFDDLAEGRADDHADGEIDDIARKAKFLEFLQHRHALLLFGDRWRPPQTMLAWSLP